MDCTCGLDKKKKPCSMKECAKRKQVRYWGVKKADSRILQSAGTPRDLNVRRQKLITERIVNNAALKKLKNEIQFSKNKVRNEQIKKEAAKLLEKRKEINAKLAKINKSLELVEPKPKKVTTLRKSTPMVDPAMLAAIKKEEKKRIKRLMPKLQILTN